MPSAGHMREHPDLTGKALQKHDSNTTDVPKDGGDDVCSLTETWAESSPAESTVCGRKRSHSRKPRTGRRAKAAANLEMMVEARFQARQNSRAESGPGMAFLGTLLECMEEDLDSSAHRHHEGRLDECCSLSDPEAAEKEDVAAMSSSSELHEFEVRLHRKTHVSLGMSVNVLEDSLLVEWCSDSGEVLVGIWNAMSARTVRLRAGDRIVSCNGISDPESMLKHVSSGLGHLRLQVQRGPFALPEPPALPAEFGCCQVTDGTQIDHAESVLEVPHDSASSHEGVHLELEWDQHLALSADRRQLQELIAQRLAKSRGS